MHNALYVHLKFLSLIYESLDDKRFYLNIRRFLIFINPFFLSLPKLAQSHRNHTLFKIPLTRNAPRLSGLLMNRGLLHRTFPSSGTLRSHSGKAASLLHLAPFPIMNSSLGSPGRFLLTRLTVDCIFTNLYPSFFFVLASVSDFSSFCDRDVNGGVGGRVGRVATST